MNSTFSLFFVIVVIGCLAGVSSDIYAPSLKAISIDFQTHIDHVQMSMAIFMIGLSLSQLIYGPLSEGIGRKKTLYIGMCVALFGTIVSFFAQDIAILIIGRLIQGLGAGASATLWRAIFRDCFEGDELAKYSSYLVIAVILIIPAAPALGGVLQDSIGWRASFGFLLLYTFVGVIVLTFVYKETSQHHAIEKLNFFYIKKAYREVLYNKKFIGYSLCSFFSYGAFFSWFNTGPVLMIDKVGLTASEFGWFTFIAGGSAMGLSGYVNGKLVQRYKINFTLQLGWLIMLFAGFVMFAWYYFFGITFAAIAIPFVLFYFGATFIWPGCFAGAFQDFGKSAGYAASCYGAIQMGGGALIGSLVSYLPDQNQIPLSLVFIGCTVVAWGIYRKVVV